MLPFDGFLDVLLCGISHIVLQRQLVKLVLSLFGCVLSLLPFHIILAVFGKSLGLFFPVFLMFLKVRLGSIVILLQRAGIFCLVAQTFAYVVLGIDRAAFREPRAVAIGIIMLVLAGYGTLHHNIAVGILAQELVSVGIIRRIELVGVIGRRRRSILVFLIFLAL